MIELERHIEILLLRNDCVIVPGLGGFMASHITARYDENDNMFLPPLRTLGFNPKLNVNDSLLAQSYSEAYDISYPDACIRIENEVNELKQHINNDGFYELTDIGTLQLNENGNIEFKPCEAGILTPDLYSLSSFDMKKASKFCLSEKNNEEAVDSKISTVQFATSPVISDYNGISACKENEGTETSDKTIKIRLSLLRNLFAIFITIIVFLLLSNPINNDDNKMLKMGNIDHGIIQNLIDNSYNNITNKDNISLKNAESTIIDRNKTDKSKVSKEIIQHSKPEHNYFCIVLASRVTKKNADSFAKHLNSIGFDKAAVLAENNTSVKVIYGRYKTQSDAYNELNELKCNENFYDAWIYQVKE